ncbi:MAG: CorA family divalent cation transporter, partial [Candidatus Saccharimonadales bacterium]
GETSYIFVRFADKNKDGDFDTLPLLFVFGEEILMTISLKHLPSLDSFTGGKINFATTQRARLVLQILQQVGEHYDGYISGTSRQIKSIRARLRGHEIGNQDFIDFVTIEDELNEFYSSLQPMNAMLRRLLLGRHIPLYEDDRDIVEDILLNNEQSMEACTSNIKSIRNIREAYSAISSHNLNRTIKILTVATVVITIPLSITAIYSMNVALPGQHDPNAFWAIIAAILIVVILLFVVGRRKRIF